MAAAALAFSAMSALVKVASATLPTGQIVAARAAVTLLLSAAMVARLRRRAGVSPWGTRRLGLVARGGFGFFALGCYYWSIGRLPLAEATMIQQSAPIWGAILAWLILAEPVSRSTAIALGLGMVGVALVAQPSGHGAAPVAVVVAIVGAVASAAALVTVRQLAPDEHPLVIVFYFPAGGDAAGRAVGGAGVDRAEPARVAGAPRGRRDHAARAGVHDLRTGAGAGGAGDGGRLPPGRVRGRLGAGRLR
jgi:drug/metabolite transporter (DMT)-like permease